MIEMYIRYISDFENNQRKLAEYDKIEKYMVDDGRQFYLHILKNVV